MGAKIPITHLPTGTEGYGQLSISTSAQRAVQANHNAAGLWALVGAPADVDKLKAGGPGNSAAIVAHSTDSHIALSADSQLGIAVQGISHNAKSAAISGSNPGGLAGSFNGNMVVSGLATIGTLTTTGAVSFPTVSVTGNINLSGVLNVAAGGDIQLAGRRLRRAV